MKANEVRLQPMKDINYRLMTLLYKFASPFCNAKQHLEHIPVKKGMVVVDYGCGPGRYTLNLSKIVGQKGRVIALDIHPKAIETIKVKAARKFLTNIEPLLIESYNTGIQDSSVDLVLLIDTLPLIKDLDSLLREIHRMLKEDGCLFVSHGRISVVETRTIMEKSGLFTIQECRGHDILATLRSN